MSTQANRELERLFQEMAVLLALSGENEFRIRTYENVARVIGNLDRDASDLLESGELGKIPGIGRSTLGKVSEYLETGSIKTLEEMRGKFPPGLMDMLRVPGFGPKRAKVVYDKLGVASLHELEEAARSGQLAKLPGFGDKSAQNIAEGIEFIKKTRDRFLWIDAWKQAAPAVEALQRDKSTVRVEVGGSLRRRKETVRDIDLLASSKDPEKSAEAFLAAVKPDRITGRGETKVSVVTGFGIAADLRIVSDEQFPYALHHFTGSKEHNVAMRGRAQDRGFKMNEYGLFRETQKGEDLVPCKTEEDIFKALGLAYIPPEIRENMGEIHAAEENRIPTLIEKSDIKGAVHVHSTWSDGHDSIARLAEAAKGQGFEYLVVCDHSRSAAYAGGLGPEELKQQGKEIKRVNAGIKGFRLFSGTEADILPDGTLDFPDKALEVLDVVFASVHSRFNLSEKQQTERIIKAVRHPLCHVLGHPTGRLLLQREAYPVDLGKIFDACAESGTAVEINGNPNRLDLDWRWVRRAKEGGVKIVCTCDAHTADTLSHTFLAVHTARKGWLEKGDVLNTLSARDFAAALRKGG